MSNLHRRAATFVALSLAFSGCQSNPIDSFICENIGEEFEIVDALILPGAASTLPYQFSPNYEGLSEFPSFALVNAPDWLQIDETSGGLSGTPAVNDVHAGQSFLISICDETDRTRSVFEASLQVEHREAYVPKGAYDFHLHDYDGNPRELRNHLAGDLSGEVIFVQSHAVSPSGNHVEDPDGDHTKSRFAPNVNAWRDAQLLFIPATEEPPTTVDVEVFRGKDSLGVFPMAHPNALLNADTPTEWDIQLSLRAWSVVLPYDQVVDSLSLIFTIDRESAKEKSGALRSENIVMAPATAMILRTLRLGMLTHPETQGGQGLLNDPVGHAADYFQTIPLSTLIAASYADMTLERVMVNSGVIYDIDIQGASPGEGGVHKGDMRENVAKSQVSVGINLANIGVTSHNMSQTYTHGIKQTTNHHAWGMYTDPSSGKHVRIQHGLSGGNGIGTLWNSSGNEASHEWGHGYGLGHYPGVNLTPDGRWTWHHGGDSGWSWHMYRNLFRNGIRRITDNAIRYTSDPMSDGTIDSPISQFTYATSYTARQIQAHLAQYDIPDASSPTGYVRWNPELAGFAPVETTRLPIKEEGVPVATLLGAYDLKSMTAVVYPVFHGNHGNIFDLPEPSANTDEDACWLSVTSLDGSVHTIAVAEKPHQGSNANQFHVNLHAQTQPTAAALLCRFGEETTVLDERSFDPTIPELPPVAKVGGPHGIEQIKTLEIAKLNEALRDVEEDIRFRLAPQLRQIVESYPAEEVLAGLDPLPRESVRRILKDRETASILSAILGFSDAQQWDALRLTETVEAVMKEADILSSPQDWVLSASPLTLDNVFIPTHTNANNRLFTEALSGNIEAIDPLDMWMMDVEGKIHSMREPHLCMDLGYGGVTLLTCRSGSASQAWTQNPENGVLRNVSTGSCIDFDRANNALIPYTCHNNWNQRWSRLNNIEAPWFAVLSGQLLDALLQRIPPTQQTF